MYILEYGSLLNYIVEVTFHIFKYKIDVQIILSPVVMIKCIFGLFFLRTLKLFLLVNVVQLDNVWMMTKGF